MLQLSFVLVVAGGVLWQNSAPAQEAESAAFMPTIDRYDGFETPTLSKLWETDRFTPGAVAMQTNIVRAGRIPGPAASISRWACIAM